MTTWQNNAGGGYPRQEGPYPNSGYPPNPGYPPNTGYPPNPGYPPNQGYPPNPGYPPSYPGSVPPEPGFIPPVAPPYGQAPPSSGPGMYGSNYAEDPMRDEVKGFEFNDESIRRGFIRKVYSILMLQLLLSVGVIALFTNNESTRKWFDSNPQTVWVALAVTFVLLICMACCSSVRRKAPMNFIFLGVFTFAEAFLLGAISTRYLPEEILLAVSITTVVCFALTIFAFQTKWDFTALNGILFVALIIFVLFGFIAMFFHTKIMTLVYSSIGALLFSVYLVYDTQMMMGGQHKYSVSPEEYIFAALSLYLDIVNIFLYILTIIGASRD